MGDAVTSGLGNVGVDLTMRSSHVLKWKIFGKSGNLILGEWLGHDVLFLNSQIRKKKWNWILSSFTSESVNFTLSFNHFISSDLVDRVDPQSELLGFHDKEAKGWQGTSQGFLFSIQTKEKMCEDHKPTHSSHPQTRELPEKQEFMLTKKTHYGIWCHRSAKVDTGCGRLSAVGGKLPRVTICGDLGSAVWRIGEKLTRWGSWFLTATNHFVCSSLGQSFQSACNLGHFHAGNVVQQVFLTNPDGLWSLTLPATCSDQWAGRYRHFWKGKPTLQHRCCDSLMFSPFLQNTKHRNYASLQPVLTTTQFQKVIHGQMLLKKGHGHWIKIHFMRYEITYLIHLV